MTGFDPFVLAVVVQHIQGRTSWGVNVPWPYEFPSYLWPLLLITAFIAVLTLAALRHRTAPGAIPFIILGTGSIAWVLVSGLKLAATNDTTKIFWQKCESTLVLPLVVVALCFVATYAGLNRWLTRPTLALLAVFPLVYALLVFTNEAHHLVWQRMWYDGGIRADFGPAQWAAIVYGYLLSLVQLSLLAWLFVRSPPHRWIAGALIVALFSIRGSFLLDIVGWNPVEPVNPAIFVLIFALLPYALAVFRFRMFEVVPVARDAVVERMADGMIVLDGKRHIVDVNESAEQLLGVKRAVVMGKEAVIALRAHPGLLALAHEAHAGQKEMCFGGSDARWYQVSSSPLSDGRGFSLGMLLWFHDVTAQRRAQAEFLDHQRTLAMMQERELLARELHDGIGQMLAAAHLQVSAARQLLGRGALAAVASNLQRLAEMTQEGKDSVRAFLLGVKTGSAPEQGLVAWLRLYLEQYSNTHGIHVELLAPPDVEQMRMLATVEAQLKFIVQEALTNVRRHAGASTARIVFALHDGWLHLTVEDDGKGFDPERLGENPGFGVRAMRGRAEAVGARLGVQSVPGKGTQIILQVPWRRDGT